MHASRDRRPPEHIEKLRASGDGELQVHGSGKLMRWLLANGLVGEINLLTVPLVIGQGGRLFPEEGPDIRLDLVCSYDTTGGLIHRAYAVSGRPAYRRATFAEMEIKA